MEPKKNEKTCDDTLEKYLATIYIQSHSQYSVKSYRTAIIGSKNGFRTFLQIKYNCDELQLSHRIKNEELDVYNILSEYVIFVDKNGIKPKTIRLWFSVVKGYFFNLGVETYSEKCNKLVKLPKVIRVKKEPLTKEILIKLFHSLNPKLQAAVLVAISSGMRVGEIAGLKLSDIDFTSDPVKVNIRAETSKSREDRETFLSKEAVDTLKDYLIRNFAWQENMLNSEIGDLRIFGRTNKIRSNGNQSRLPTAEEQKGKAILLQRALTRKIQKVPELNRLNRNDRRVIHFHVFREYFYTNTTNIAGSNFAHALMGHHEYLDTYYTLSDDQRNRLYLKVEPHLTLNNLETEEELEKIQERAKEMEDTYEKLKIFLKQRDPSYEEFTKIMA